MKIATICYIKKDGYTLMLKRTKKKNDIHEGKWVGVGGKMELGESPEDCIRREVFEETGLTLKNLKLKGFLSFPGFEDEEDWYSFAFESTDFEGELIDSPEGELAWIKDDKIKDLNMWEGDIDFLEWMKKDRIFSGKITYDKGKFIKSEVIFY